MLMTDLCSVCMLSENVAEFTPLHRSLCALAPLILVASNPMFMTLVERVRPLTCKAILVACLRELATTADFAE